MDHSDLNIVILSFVFVFVILIVIIFAIAFLANKKKSEFLLEKQEALRKFENEIAKSRIEIQEHDLKNISWELHDNVGQLLSVSKLQLSMIGRQVYEKDQKILDDTIEIISTILSEIRLLSKSLNQDYILFQGLVKSTRIELERFNRLNYLDARFNIVGEECTIGVQDEILLYRIIQEVLSNVIKHAKATTLNTTFFFEEHLLTILIADNGKGIKEEEMIRGLGFSTMMSRVQLLNATIDFRSVSTGGLEVCIRYPIS